jgi:hypothetical protein
MARRAGLEGRSDRGGAAREACRCLRTLAACAILLWLCTGGAAAASKDNRVFTVGNYPVEARAADAVAAKTRAIAEGQQNALRSLLRRIVPVTAYNSLPKLKSTPAGNLIEAIAVRSERNSPTEYIATYDFVFQAEAVRRILDSEGIPFLDRQAPQVTLLPVYRTPTGAEVPEVFADSRGSDAWLYAWKGLDLANTLTPLDLKPLRRQVHPDALAALLAGDLAAVRSVASEYGTDTVVLAILEPDLQQKRAKVMLIGRDAVAPFVLRRAYRLDGGDLAYTAELAAVIGLGVLEGRWKAINIRSGSAATAASGPGLVPRPGAAPRGDTGGPVRIAVEFRSMSEWQQISRRLAETPEISDLDVEGLSARGARITLRYPGGPQALALELAQQGLILRNLGDSWILSQR